MGTSFQYEQIQLLCQLLFANERVTTLTSHDGMPIYLKYQNLAEIGTLPVVAQTTHQYLQLLDGDIAITNDPYSGGTILSNLYLCIGVSSEQKRNRQVDLLIVKKIALKPKIVLSNNIDEEGLRIPPTPLVVNGQLNKDILMAMSEHPLAPNGFQQAVLKGLDEIKNLHRQFLQFNQIFDMDWSRSFIRDYFKDTQSAMMNFLGQIRSGEQNAEVELNDGSLLKLNIEVNDERILFDFSGSDTSRSVHLTHSAALGGCTGALIALNEKHMPINHGIFKCIEIVAPEGSMVHAKYPNPVYFGMTDGVASIANLVLKAIGNLDKSKRFPLSGVSSCSFNLEFDQGYFFETLEPGSAASQIQNGLDGLNLWRRSALHPSIEEVERRFPLTIDSCSFRPNSGGDGRYTGGKGVVKTFVVKKECQFTWSISEPNEKPLGILGGKDAQNADVFLVRQGQEKQHLAKIGHLNLRPEDKIIIQSAGGGGYGDNSEDKS
ncbi:MAG: hydantoinase B/oxoprolinase family protein [Bdellovibrionales bacterium]|nr:hydantoinase B/oxoprolinase family protein [Bdellovibrionales bacterium]